MIEIQSYRGDSETRFLKEWMRDQDFCSYHRTKEWPNPLKGWLWGLQYSSSRHKIISKINNTSKGKFLNSQMTRLKWCLWQLQDKSIHVDGADIAKPLLAEQEKADGTKQVNN